MQHVKLFINKTNCEQNQANVYFIIDLKAM